MELNKKLQTYGLISTSAIGIETTQLVRPSNSLKFRVMNNKINFEFKRHKKTWQNKNKRRKSNQFFYSIN